MSTAHASHLAPPYSDREQWARLSWREKLRAYTRPPRRLEFTTVGKWFFWLTVAVGVAAVNSGNNLLYLVLGAQLALIIVSGFLSEAMLRGIVVERWLPERAVAGQPLLVEFRVTNKKRWAPSFSLILRDIVEGPGAPRRTRKNRWVGPEAFVPRVGPGETVLTRYRLSLPRRGEFAVRRMLLATRFPFGFFEKWREYDGSSELLALPATAAERPPRSMWPALIGEQSIERVGRGVELYGLRDARPGDDRRALAQKATARLDRPVVREFEQERARRVEIAVHNLRLHAAEPPSVAADAKHPTQIPHTADPLAQLTGRAAGLAANLIGRRTTVSLAAHGASVPPGEGVGHLERILGALARMAPVEEPGPLPVVDPQAERLVLNAPSPSTPQPGIRTPKPGTRNQEPGTQS